MHDDPTYEETRWRQIMDLLAAALERAPGKRAAFLDRARVHGDVRREVDELLAEDKEDFLDSPAFHLRGSSAPEPEARTRVGPYRLIRRLGHGGMGEVYEAERDEEDFRQRVAIKLMRRGMATDELVRRFRAERRILAGLEHPSIARLIDGGTTEDGLPYLVMEYVEGEPLDRYCTRRRLPTRARLALFVQICEAVQVAHRHLVVHRDLKPANILITGDGVAKLLDFGIAKLLSFPEMGGDATPSGGGSEAGFTGGAGRLMTPTYASPEQILGDSITTASDVYTLGILLFAMLTGRLPFRSRDSAGALRLPPAPSSVASQGPEPRAAGGESSPDGFERCGDPKKLRRELAGDLDAIVLKAMAPRIDDRYATVEQLSGDVARHLAGEPVAARPPTRFYRLGKLARRRKRELIAAAAFVSLGLSLLAVGLERRNVAEERQRLEKEYEHGRQLARFMVRVLSSADPVKNAGEKITFADMLERSAADAAESLAEYPVSQAAILNAIGGIDFNRGEYERAQELFAETVRLRRLAFEPRSWRIGLALNNLAFVMQQRGDYAAAERVYRQALDRPHFGPAGDPWLAAMAFDNLGISLRSQGKMAEAEAAHRRGLEIRRQLYGDRPHRTIADSLNNLAIVLRQTGRYDEAEALYREALTVIERLGQEDKGGMSSALGNLGKLQCERGRLDEGEATLRRSLEILRQIYGDSNHPALAHPLREIGVCLQLGGDLAEAEALYREAIGIYEQRQELDHPELARTLRELATVLAARGDLTAAEETARRALDVYRSRLPPNHWRIADVESVLGGCLFELGRVDEALPLLERGYRGVKTVRGESTREVREARDRLLATGDAP